MRKVIFLDIDGVVNIPPYLTFNPECLINLYMIIEATGAELVISSSWRCRDMDKLKGLLKENGFDQKYLDKITGETERGYHFMNQGSYLAIVRGNEIKTWIDRNLVYPWHADPSLTEEYKLKNEDGSFKRMRSNQKGKDYQYVILDDDSDMLYDQRNNFVHCDGLKGLTIDDVAKAIIILNRKF